jgi:hypothetical protein
VKYGNLRSTRLSTELLIIYLLISASQTGRVQEGAGGAVEGERGPQQEAGRPRPRGQGHGYHLMALFILPFYSYTLLELSNKAHFGGCVLYDRAFLHLVPLMRKCTLFI